MEAQTAARHEMVRTQIVARGVRDPAVVQAMRNVPREAFVRADLAEFAFEDAPLPIEAGQTISQPYIVAAMAAALELDAADRVLEIGTGSGYAAAVLSRIAAEVYTVERHEELARLAEQRCRELGYDNVHVLHGDGTLGWTAHAPYDAIVVAAGGPDVPPVLLEQLAVGGRLVIPIGPTPREQRLVRVTRAGLDGYEREDLGGVRFVPLIGEAGWGDEEEAGRPRPAASRPETVARLLREVAAPIADVETCDLGAVLERIGDARVVLLGEATHGTSEFYRMRARLTRELIVHRGFTMVAVEADWPDAARIDHYVRRLPTPVAPWKAFTRFPTWMWRNTDVAAFVRWLRAHNEGVPAERAVGFYGLDLYSLYTSIDAVLNHLDHVALGVAARAPPRYGCLTPWEHDPATYGRAVVTGAFRGCERQAVAMLRAMLAKRLEYEHTGGEQFGGARFFDAVQNARLVADAERYYRIMYYGSRESWNLRDQHMFDTLQALLAFHGPETKAVVWEHNSHVGDAAATEMGVRGELNVGQLCRQTHGEAAFLVGFGTDHGTVAAASSWDAPMEVKHVRPAHPESYERLCHQAGVPAFLLHLRHPARAAVREELGSPRLERAIGVIYRPESELQSHYFQALLPRQFDEYAWFDETRAVTPLGRTETHGVPETYPFGL
jgi:protein-L-isoaspartate(D-aspartate) O-methyltransferase